jgi:purine catabolism regulator
LLTVSDLVSSLALPVRAGAERLDAQVRWVHISELLDPTPWMSGGEVLLTTGMQLDSAEHQREFLSRIADHGVAGLGFGTGFRHATVPRALLDAAAAREFPLFEVPYEVPFIAITEAAFTRLVNEQYDVLRRALAAHDRLERIVLSEQGLAVLSEAIATLIDGSVVVFDGRFQARANGGSLDEAALTELARDLSDRGNRSEARVFIPTLAHWNGGAALALPVTGEDAPGNGRAPEAWLVAVKDSSSLSDFDRLILRQAVTIVALELMRGRVAEETERRLAGDVLRAMADGELGGPELAQRLTPFGLGETVATIVSEDGSLTAALRDEATPALAASIDGLTCALIPGREEEELFALARRIGKRLAPAPVGVGRTIESALARRSFHEARCALEAAALGVSTNGTGLATYRDLGSFQLLLSLQDDDALRLFCDSILGPIESSEGRYGGELIRSLEAFIECNGQWERAAQQLYCHRHTLRYRMRRIETLTGRSLQNARDRIDFWLALRGRELVGGFGREYVK